MSSFIKDLKNTVNDKVRDDENFEESEKDRVYAK